MTAYPNNVIQNITGISGSAAVRAVPTRNANVGSQVTYNSKPINLNQSTGVNPNRGSISTGGPTYNQTPVNTGSLQAASGASHVFNNLKSNINAINIDGNIGYNGNSQTVSPVTPHVTSNMGTQTQSIDIRRNNGNSNSGYNPGGNYNGGGNYGVTPGVTNGGGYISPTNPTTPVVPSPENSTTNPGNNGQVNNPGTQFGGNGTIYIDDGRFLKDESKMGDKNTILPVEPEINNGGSVFIGDGRTISNPGVGNDTILPVEPGFNSGGNIRIDDGRLLKDESKMGDRNTILPVEPEVNTGGNVFINDGRIIGNSGRGTNTILPVEQKGGMIYIDDGSTINSSNNLF